MAGSDSTQIIRPRTWHRALADAGRPGPHALHPRRRGLRQPRLDLRAEVRRPARPRPLRRPRPDAPQPQQQAAGVAVPRDRRGAPPGPPAPGDHRRRGGLPRRVREDELPRAAAAVPPRRRRGDPPEDGTPPGLPLRLRRPLPRPLRRDPAAALAAPASCSARPSPGPTASASPTSVPGKGIEAWERACEAAEEGIVGKRLDSLYVPGRSDAWVKIKCVGRQEFVIARLDRPATLARRPRGPARRLLRGRPAPLRGQGRHGIHPRGPARPPPPVRRAGPEGQPLRRRRAAARRGRPLGRAEAGGGDRLRRVDPERAAPPAAVRGAPPRQEGQRVPPRAARTGRGRPQGGRRPITPGRAPPCRWRSTTPSATSPRPASRRARRRPSRTSSRSSSCRSTTPRSCTTTSAWRPTACSRAGRSPRARRWTRR